MMSNLRADFQRYFASKKNPSFIRKALIFFHNPGMWFSLSYRFTRMFLTSRFKLARGIGVIFNVLHFYFSYFILDYLIECWCDIGPGLYLHTKYISVTSAAKIGRNVSIMGQVVIGSDFDGTSPTIGDYVAIGVGAKIIGDVKVGEGSIIGANTVVVHDVKPYSVVGGVPAKFIKKVKKPFTHWPTPPKKPE